MISKKIQHIDKPGNNRNPTWDPLRRHLESDANVLQSSAGRIHVPHPVGVLLPGGGVSSSHQGETRTLSQLDVARKWPKAAVACVHLQCYDLRLLRRTYPHRRSQDFCLGGPGQRHPAWHQSCTRLKLSRSNSRQSHGRNPRAK